MVECTSCFIYGFNLFVKAEQAAAINIAKDVSAFTMLGWKFGKVMPSWVLGFDK
jgi:hypothetical protein